MRIGKGRQTVSVGALQFDVRRTPEGVMEMWGEDDLALAAALGYAHGFDRMMQLMLIRLAGQGCLSECLQNNKGNLDWDKRARSLRLAADAAEDVANLSVEARQLIDHYCLGLNYCLENQGYPWEFRLARYKPAPWTPADCILTLKVVAYVALAESQQEMEKFIIRSIRAGVDHELLRDLFHPHLEGLSNEVVELVQKTWIPPDSHRTLIQATGLKGSNNWVVAGNRTASGLPLECHDPHMGAHQLPAFWYEFIQHKPNDFRIGVSIPGMPGMQMGRTRKISYSFTFGFMDMVDYFIEEVRGGQCRRALGWEPIRSYDDEISPRGQEPIKLKIWESSLGVLEAPLDSETVPDNLYLCRAWTGERLATAKSLNALLKAPSASSVSELQTIFADATISCNFLMADTLGNIGYQQSGRLPLRQHSGLFPVKGWDYRLLWKGFASRDQLARVTNPAIGFLVTANNDLNQDGKPLSINLPMGSERADRIHQLLEPLKACAVEDMKRIQRDRYSLQAELYMNRLRPLLPASPVAVILMEWDCQYMKDSKGAVLFEAFYSQFLEEVFGKGWVGVETWRREVASTGLLADYYHFFDKVLLGDNPAWFGLAGQDEVIRTIIGRVLNHYPTPASVPTWGEKRRVMMANLFFQAKLPRSWGFDYGPISLEGNRATIVQGAIYASMGTTRTFAPSYRYITDLAENKVHTALAGGPSDRRFSRHYLSDIERWLSYGYKVLEGSTAAAIEESPATVSTVEESFEVLKTLFQPRNLFAGIDRTLEYRISGDGGGTWTVRISNRSCHIERGEVPDADWVVSVKKDDWLDMVNGKMVNAYWGFTVCRKGPAQYDKDTEDWKVSDQIWELYALGLLGRDYVLPLWARRAGLTDASELDGITSKDGELDHGEFVKFMKTGVGLEHGPKAFAESLHTKHFRHITWPVAALILCRRLLFVMLFSPFPLVLLMIWKYGAGVGMAVGVLSLFCIPALTAWTEKDTIRRLGNAALSDPEFFRYAFEHRIIKRIAEPGDLPELRRRFYYYFALTVLGAVLSYCLFVVLFLALYIFG